MAERTWRILDEFPQPIRGEDIRLVTHRQKLIVPPGVEEAIRTTWNRELQTKQAELAQIGDVTSIGEHSEKISGNTLDALYADERRIMWSGPQVTLKEIAKEFCSINPRVRLFVSPTHYAFTTGLSDPEVIALYVKYGVERPRPPLAICTFAITPDNEGILTVRGPRANKYPGRKYGQGGDPRTSDVNIVDHQIREMKDEILVGPEEYNPREFQFGGIVEDREMLPGKTDLISWVRINLGFDEVDDRVRNRARHPNDAVAIASFPATDEGLMRYVSTLDPQGYNPPTIAGLVLYGKMNFGEYWYQDLLKQL